MIIPTPNIRLQSAYTCLYMGMGTMYYSDMLTGKRYGIFLNNGHITFIRGDVLVTQWRLGSILMQYIFNYCDCID